MRKKRNVNIDRTVAIELNPTYLRVAIATRTAPGKPSEMNSRLVRWRNETTTLHTEAGVAELVDAFKKLVAEEHLSGEKVRFTLSGDYCVTRVLSGTNERVRRELNQAQQRCQRYLTLGPGEKAIATSVRAIDARHQHALLAVANRKTLDALVRVAAAADVEIELVEPSVVALCRVVGRLGHDAEEPVMLIDFDEKGAQLGISYQGQLLLDYRPGGHSVHDGIGQIILQHLARLKRYCQRFLRFTGGPLRKVYLCAAAEFAAKAYESFSTLPRGDVEDADQLTVQILDVEHVEDGLRLNEEPPYGDLAPAIGTCLIETQDEDASRLNLMEGIQRRDNRGWRRELVRLAAPIAATLLIAAGTLGVVVEKQRECQTLEASLASFSAASGKAQELRLTLMQVEDKEKQWRSVREHLVNPPWHELMRVVGGCLPNDVWLEKLQFDGKGEVSLTGGSYAEDGVFEFAGWLDKSPPLSDVALEGTNANSSRAVGAVGFALKCRLVNFSDREKEQQDAN
ncbi:MAG: PilN domain-containing protein [Planctomycetales bacterium]|nr:PilN domain-containing protein [Planctomycetales bacterium]